MFSFDQVEKSRTKDLYSLIWGIAVDKLESNLGGGGQDFYFFFPNLLVFLVVSNNVLN